MCVCVGGGGGCVCVCVCVYVGVLCGGVKCINVSVHWVIQDW